MGVDAATLLAALGAGPPPLLVDYAHTNANAKAKTNDNASPLTAKDVLQCAGRGGDVDKQTLLLQLQKVNKINLTTSILRIEHVSTEKMLRPWSQQARQLTPQ